MTTPLSFGVGTRPKVEAGDVDNDGFADLVVRTFEGSNFRIRTYLGDASGQFTLAHDRALAGGTGFGDMHLTDLNGDGLYDLIVSISEGGSNNSSVALLLGDEYGEFTISSDYAGDGHIIAPGDYDGDGQTDVAKTHGHDFDMAMLGLSQGFESPPGETSSLVKDAAGEFTRTYLDGTTATFDATGLHIATTDSNGNATTFVYEGERLAEIIDPLDKTLLLQDTNSDGYTDLITYPGTSGRTISLVHDVAGDLRAIVDPDMTTRQFAYDGQHRLVSQRSKRGFETIYRYDFAGRIYQTTIPALVPYTRGAEPTNTKGLIDPNSVSGPAAVTQKAEVVGSFTDGEGATQTYQLNRFGAAVSSTNEGTGLTTHHERDEQGNLTRLITPDGAVTTITYDDKQNPIQIDDSVRGGSALLSYDPEHNRVRTVTFSDDPSSNADDRVTILDYDDRGNLTAATSPEQRQATIPSYDAYGLADSETDQFGVTSTFIYDEDATSLTGGLLTQVVSDSDDTLFPAESDRITTFTYTAEGYLDTVVDSEQRSFDIDYDPMGRAVRVVRADGESVLTSYDAGGNVDSVTPPGLPAHRFMYTFSGQLSEYDPPDIGLLDDRTLYHYNRSDQLTRIDFPYDAGENQGQLIVTYGAGARIETITQPNGRVITYDYYTSGESQPDSTAAPLGNLERLSSNDGSSTETLTYTYEADLLRNVTFGGQVTGNVSYDFDSERRLKSLSVNSELAIAHEYDDDGLAVQTGDLVLSRHTVNDPINHGLVKSTSLSALTPEGEAIFEGTITTDRQYNGYGELTHETATVNDSTAAGGTRVVYSVSYGRDRLGRITQKTETIDSGAGPATNTYVYNFVDSVYGDADRLESVTVNQSTITEYEYDQNGNRTDIIVSGISQVSSIEYDDQNRLRTYDVYDLDYTANGELKTQTNTATSATTHYTYDTAGNLLSALLPDNTSLDYILDARNRRIGVKVNGALIHRYLYKDQLNPIAQLDGQGVLVAEFIYADSQSVPAYIRKKDASGNYTTYRVIADHLGSVRLVINTSTGLVVHRIDYDEWGQSTVVVGAEDFQPFGFAGGLRDVHTGLTRFGARDYDPTIGRFVTSDPIGLGGGLNVYLYADANPVSYVDQSGLYATAVLGVGIRAVGGRAAAGAVGRPIARALGGGRAGHLIACALVFYCDEIAEDADGDASDDSGQCGGVESPSPALTGNPWSPSEVDKRRSETRRQEGAPSYDPDSQIPDRGPGGDQGGHKSRNRTPHDTGERNVNRHEEHSRVPKKPKRY